MRYGYFPHRFTSLHTSVQADKRCLDIGAVVSLTSSDMMYTLLILAHALGEKNLQILSVFTKIISRLQKLKNAANLRSPTNTLRKLVWSCIYTRAASEIQFIYWKWSEERQSQAPTDSLQTAAKWQFLLIPTSIRAVPFRMHWRRCPCFYLGHNLLFNILMRNIGTTSQRVWVRMQCANAIILANGDSALGSRNIVQEELSSREDWDNKNGWNQRV